MRRIRESREVEQRLEEFIDSIKEFHESSTYDFGLKNVKRNGNTVRLFLKNPDIEVEMCFSLSGGRVEIESFKLLDTITSDQLRYCASSLQEIEESIHDYLG